MKNKKLLLIPAIIIPILVAGIFFINKDTKANISDINNNEIEQAIGETLDIQDIENAQVKEEIAYEVPPITTEKAVTKPQTEVFTDTQGNQVITPNVVVPNPNGATPKPGTETKVETPKIETPTPTEKPKTETPKTENKPTTPSKPKPSGTPSPGDRRVVNGKEEVYDRGFGWLQVTGSETEIADFELSGNIIGH